jgi:hypothetical protein
MRARHEGSIFDEAGISSRFGIADAAVLAPDGASRPPIAAGGRSSDARLSEGPATAHFSSGGPDGREGCSPSDLEWSEAQEEELCKILHAIEDDAAPPPGEGIGSVVTLDAYTGALNDLAANLPVPGLNDDDLDVVAVQLNVAVDGGGLGTCVGLEVAAHLGTAALACRSSPTAARACLQAAATATACPALQR